MVHEYGENMVRKTRTKNNMSTSDTDTIKGETHLNIRGRNDRSNSKRKVASNLPGPNLDYSSRIEVNSSMVIMAD